VSVQPYRLVLDRPGVRSLLLVTLLARIPVAAAPIILTLHVVLDLHLGFAASGAVAAMMAVGAAVGAPAIGSAMDKLGLRPVLILTTTVDSAFWLFAGHLGFVALIPTAFIAGMLALPVFTIARQSLAAMVPPQQRQAGFSLDSMSVEVSFAVGPAMGVVAITQFGASVAFLAAAVLIAISGLALIRLDPPVRGEEGVDAVLGGDSRNVAQGDSRNVARTDSRVATAAPVVTPSVRDWATPRVLGVLVATFGATLTLSGTETAFTAAMRSFGEVGLLGTVVAVWCVASLVGGFIYGMQSRRVEPLILLALLAVLTLPLAFAGAWWVLAIIAIPTGLFCAPLISSTAEMLTGMTPAAVRGQVMGLHASSLTVGNAIGAPLVGVVVDRSSAGTGFVSIGVMGLTIALSGLLVQVVRKHTVHANAHTEREFELVG
jgi:MFS family permease